MQKYNKQKNINQNTKEKEDKDMSAVIDKPSVFEVITSKENYDKTVERINETRLPQSFLDECIRTSELYRKTPNKK